MIDILYVLLEALAVLLCLHALYGKKFELNRHAILFIILDCLVMSAIRVFSLNQIFSLIVYFFIMMYCLIVFENTKRTALVNMILLAIIMTCIQFVVSVLFSGIDYFIFAKKAVLAIIINLIVLMIMVGIYKKINLHAVSKYFQRKEILIAVTLILESGAVCFLLLRYKSVQGMLPEKYIVLAGMIIFIIILCFNSLLYKVKYQEKKSELEVYKTYSAVGK